MEKLPEAYHSNQTQKLILDYLREESNDGYWVWFIKDDYEYLSPRFKEILGFKDDEMENNPASWLCLLSESDQQLLMKNVNSHFEHNTRYDQIVRFRCKDPNKHVWIRCRGSVVERDDDGKPVIMAGVHTDITEIKDVEERLAKLIQQKTDMMGKINHELRTPLHVIMSFAQLLQFSKQDLTNMQQINDIHEAGKHMLEVVNDIIDLSHMEINAETFLEESWIPLENAIEQSISMHQSLARSFGISISPDRLLHVKVFGDMRRVKQILINLISNAIKYNHTGGTVLISTYITKDDLLCIDVADSGFGIDNQDLDAIFEPYNTIRTKQDSQIKKNILMKSSGIGLSIVKRLIDLMDLQIEVESTVNVGSHFRIFFPITRYRVEAEK